MLKKFLAALFSVLLVIPLMAAGSGVAAADVVVKPGQFGHVCSGYKYTSNPQLYWQSCAWADNNEVYFTVHLGNASNSAWSIPVIGVDYYKSGGYYPCADVYNVVVPAHSVKQTASNVCVLPRRSAAYQSVGIVPHDGTASGAVSDTLQVQ